MFFSVLQIVSSLLVAFAPTLHVPLMGRLLLGLPSGDSGDVDRHGDASGARR